MRATSNTRETCRPTRAVELSSRCTPRSQFALFAPALLAVPTEIARARQLEFAARVRDLIATRFTPDKRPRF